MNEDRLRLTLYFLALAALFPFASSAQQVSNLKQSSKVGIGVTASTFGAGVEVAIPVAGKLNLRGGFNVMSYARTFDKDGIHYAGNLSWRSGEANLDWFPFGGRVHFSPGMVAYNGNKINATSSVPGGQTFTLNNVSYLSAASDPINGTGNLSFNKVAPTFRIGFGNLIPRSERHWSFLAEAGVAYQGMPSAVLALRGTACAPDGSNCVNAATDPTVQANVQAQQAKINHDLSLLRFYPVVSLGVGFSF